eukprot:scaffold41802_cov42-Phaeocystis_antarctica.AAC.4
MALRSAASSASHSSVAVETTPARPLASAACAASASRGASRSVSRTVAAPAHALFRREGRHVRQQPGEGDRGRPDDVACAVEVRVRAEHAPLRLRVRARLETQQLRLGRLLGLRWDHDRHLLAGAEVDGHELRAAAAVGFGVSATRRRCSSRQQRRRRRRRRRRWSAKALGRRLASTARRLCFALTLRLPFGQRTHAAGRPDAVRPEKRATSGQQRSSQRAGEQRHCPRERAHADVAIAGGELIRSRAADRAGGTWACSGHQQSAALRARRRATVPPSRGSPRLLARVPLRITPLGVLDAGHGFVEVLGKALRGHDPRAWLG